MSYYDSPVYVHTVSSCLLKDKSLLRELIRTSDLTYTNASQLSLSGWLRVVQTSLHQEHDFMHLLSFINPIELVEHIYGPRFHISFKDSLHVLVLMVYVPFTMTRNDIRLANHNISDGLFVDMPHLAWVMEQEQLYCGKVPVCQSTFIVHNNNNTDDDEDDYDDNTIQYSLCIRISKKTLFLYALTSVLKNPMHNVLVYPNEIPQSHGS